MPTLGGTIRCGEGGHTDRAEQVQAHFRQAADRGLEASTDEHRTQAGRRSTKTSGSRTRIPGDPEGDRRGHADAHRQRLDEGSKGRWSVPVLHRHSLLPGSQAKAKRRICSDFRLINNCCFLHTYPIKNAQEVSQFQDSTYFGKADLSKGVLATAVG